MVVSLPRRMHLKKKSLLPLFIVGILLVTLISPFLYPAKAEASATGYLRLDRLKASTTTGGTVCATTSTSGTEADVAVTFPTGFTVNSTAANWTVTTTNLPAGASAWPGIDTATDVSGQTVTFPSGDLSTATLYCFNFASSSTLTTPAAGDDKTGSIVTHTAGAAVIDTVSYATSIISNDQIAVTATVPATFTFALGSNTAALGTLSTGSVTSATGISATINTNAQNGWTTWVKSANAALSSSSTSDSISSPGSSNGTPESLAAQAGYVLDTNLTTDAGSGGTVTVNAEYDGSDTNSGGHLATTFQSIASADGPAAGDIVTLVVRAKAGALNKAASDYADTLTVTAAGQF